MASTSKLPIPKCVNKYLILLYKPSCPSCNNKNKAVCQINSNISAQLDFFDIEDIVHTKLTLRESFVVDKLD